jgi:hypothetical protein
LIKAAGKDKTEPKIMASTYINIAAKILPLEKYSGLNGFVPPRIGIEIKEVKLPNSIKINTLCFKMCFLLI